MGSPLCPRVKNAEQTMEEHPGLPPPKNEEGSFRLKGDVLNLFG